MELYGQAILGYTMPLGTCVAFGLTSLCFLIRPMGTVVPVSQGGDEMEGASACTFHGTVRVPLGGSQQMTAVVTTLITITITMASVMSTSSIWRNWGQGTNGRHYIYMYV